MSRMFVIAGLILFIGSGPVFAESATTSSQKSATSPVCYNDKLINTNGLAIRMGSGQRFQGYPGSNSTLSFWTPLDKVQICRLGGSAYEITNLNRKNKVKALRSF